MQICQGRREVYLNDVGTLCHLAGLSDPSHAAAGPLAGPIFETAVLSEIRKTFRARGEEPRISFFRTSQSPSRISDLAIPFGHL